MTGRFGRDIPEFADSRQHEFPGSHFEEVCHANRTGALLRRRSGRDHRRISDDRTDRAPCPTESSSRASRSQRYRRSGLQQQGTRGRRLGDRRDHGPAHALHQGSGHRRSRALPDSRPAQGQLHGVCPRLRPGGFAQGQVRTGHDAGSHSHHRAGRQDRRATLSRELLVRVAHGSRAERISRHRPRWKRYRPQRKKPGRMAPSGQNG